MADSQWSRLAVQPRNVAEMLATPLSTPRASFSSSAVAATDSTSKPQSKSQKPKSSAPGGGTHKIQKHVPKPSRPPQSSYAAANPLLTRRVYQVAEYRESFHRPPRGPKGAVGGGPAPIPVPLHYGERFCEYEERFVHWLRKKNVTLYDLRDDAHRERCYRISFANLRLNVGKHPPKPHIGDDRTGRGPPSSSVASRRSESPSPRLQSPLRESSTSRKRGVRAGGDDDDDDGRPRKIHLKQELPPPLLAPPSSSSTHANADALLLPRPAPAFADCSQPPAATAAGNPGKEQCTATLPDSTASFGAFVAAYVQCLCRECLRDWNLMLTERLDALEKEVRVLRKARAGPPSRAHSSIHPGTHGLAKDTTASDVEKPAQSVDEREPKHAAVSGDSVASATGVRSDVKGDCESEEVDGGSLKRVQVRSERSSVASNMLTDATPHPSVVDSTTAEATLAAPLQGSASGSVPSSSTTSPDVWTVADPIKTQLLDEYNSLNREILLNEQVMEDSLKRVQTTMLTDMAGAMQELDQIQQIKKSIRSEMENRNAALAILVAYCWTYKQQELVNRMEQCGSLNIPHVQRACHVKCAAFASQIKEKVAFLASLKEMLDQVIAGDDGASSIEELSGLGKQIAQEEQELAQLEQERMDEFMRLFQFSFDIRQLCKTVMAEKSIKGER